MTKQTLSFNNPYNGLGGGGGGMMYLGGLNGMMANNINFNPNSHNSP